MAVFSTVRWIFLSFTRSLNLRPVIFTQLEDRIVRLTGRHINDFDVALEAAKLPHVEALIIHDPEDGVTAYMNAERNHSHWLGSYLYRANKAGHHLGTAEVTRIVLAYLVEGAIPQGAHRNDGAKAPLPAVMTLEDLSTSGGGKRLLPVSLAWFFPAHAVLLCAPPSDASTRVSARVLTFPRLSPLP